MIKLIIYLILFIIAEQFTVYSVDNSKIINLKDSIALYDLLITDPDLKAIQNSAFTRIDEWYKEKLDKEVEQYKKSRNFWIAFFVTIIAIIIICFIYYIYRFHKKYRDKMKEFQNKIDSLQNN